MANKKKYIEEYSEFISSDFFVSEEEKTESAAQYSSKELYELAFLEGVTCYYNWNWMRERLKNYDSYGIESFAFVHFDIKDFKMVNEIFGHTVADNLLRKVCFTIANCPWSYFSCRCDNDNFAMMIEAEEEDVIRERLEDMFSQMNTLEEDETYSIYFRCGVASISDVENYRVIITDMAKMAQKLGKGANVTEINFYTDAMKEEQIKGKLIKKDLPRALNHNELMVYYQPKYNPQTNTIIGAEALIRWNYKHKEIWAPGRFVPYLEKEGAIEAIDYFVLEEVCKKLEEWKHNNKKMIPISVNISKVLIRNQNFINNILNIVNKYDVDRQYVELELTETLAYDDPQYMLQVMNKLRECGFQISLDDFGTGYSSLSMLSLMPITTLKIDKSFVDAIENEDDNKIKLIIMDILVMTKHLNIYSVAEGVETENQRDMIKEWGCNSIQGYYYSKPLPVEEFESRLVD